MKPCFNGLIGLSEKECECYSFNADLKESSLSLFIDDLEGIDLELLKNALGCGEELDSHFTSAYNSAVNFFESDLQVEISMSHKQRFSPYIGRIGERKFDKALPANTLAGLKLDTYNVDSASIVIKSVSLFFDAVGTINMQVYKNNETFGDPIAIEVVDGITEHSFTEVLNLPISEHGVKNDYYFIYTSDGPKPMNNKNKCSCTGIESVRGKFLKPIGVYGSEYYDLQTDSNFAYGISLNATISCSIDMMLCDFMADHLFNRRSGIALWYKMGVLIIEKVFASRNINFDTMSDREYLYGRKKKFEKEYKNLVMWLAENTTISNSNCFICNNAKRMTMGKNLI